MLQPFARLVCAARLTMAVFLGNTKCKQGLAYIVKGYERVDVTVLATLEGHRRQNHDVPTWKARCPDVMTGTYCQGGSKRVSHCFYYLEVTEEHCCDALAWERPFPNERVRSSARNTGVFVSFFSLSSNRGQVSHHEKQAVPMGVLARYRRTSKYCRHSLCYLDSTGQQHRDALARERQQPDDRTGTSPEKTRVFMSQILLSWRALNGLRLERATHKHNFVIFSSSWPAA